MSIRKTVAIVTSTVAVSIALIVILVVSLGNDRPAAPTVATPSDSQAASEPNLDELAGLVNKERTDRGLTALQRDPLLDQAAKNKCADMVSNNYWDHYSPSGVRGISFISSEEQGQFYGENLSARYKDAKSVDNGWMGSASHRTAILNSRFEAVGYAICDVPDYENAIVQFFIDR